MRPYRERGELHPLENGGPFSVLVFRLQIQKNTNSGKKHGCGENASAPCFFPYQAKKGEQRRTGGDNGTNFFTLRREILAVSQIEEKYGRMGGRAKSKTPWALFPICRANPELGTGWKRRGQRNKKPSRPNDRVKEGRGATASLTVSPRVEVWGKPHKKERL